MNYLVIFFILLSAVVCSARRETGKTSNCLEDEIENQAERDSSSWNFKMNPATIMVGAAVGFVAAPVALPLLGFTSGGVALGSVAAGVQSMIGNVVAGGTFAAMQSAGVVGTSLATKAALSAGGAAVASVIADKKEK